MPFSVSKAGWLLLCISVQQLMFAKLKTYFSYSFVVLVALQVLNLGLYAQDFETAKQCSGPEFNIINSVTEYIAEVRMQKRNAFPEKKEKSNQSEHESAYKFQPFKIYFKSVNIPSQVADIQHHNYGRFIVNAYSNQPSDITSPPPKIIA